MPRTILIALLTAVCALAAPPSIDFSLSARSVAGAQISPDGRYVAYGVSQADWDQNDYVTQIWIAVTATGERYQLTSGKKSSTGPQWSPDSKRLAFGSDRDGKRQIYVIAPSGGEATQLTAEEGGVNSFAWSPDGTWMAYSATGPESKARKDRKEKYGEFDVIGGDYTMSHLWRMKVPAELPADPKKGSKPEQLTQGEDFTVGSFSWSPDGTRIAFDGARDPDLGSSDTERIYVLDLAGLKVRKVVDMPSNAPDVISVGATENSHVMLPAVTVNGANVPSSLIGIAAQPSDSYPYPAYQGGNIGPLVDITQGIDSTGLACNALPANSLNGAYALIERGTCTFDVKATNAQAAGAIGVILYWADSTTVTPISGVGFNNTGDAGFIGPIMAISNAAGVALKSFIDSNPGRTVTVQSGAIEQDTTTWSTNTGFSPQVTSNNLTGFSSFGPTPDGMMKPDIVAVGGNDIGYLLPDGNDYYIPAPSGIFMPTQSYDPNQSLEGGSDFGANGYWAADGTSFATPLTAGAAALAKQAHPTLRGTQIRSLLVNSAAQTVTTDDSGIPVDAEWMGNGLLNAGAAVAASVTVEPATVSFGVVNTATFPVSQTLTVTNIGSGSLSLTTSVTCCMVNANAGSLTNATVAVSPATLNLAAGGTATLTVTLSGKAPPASEYSGQVLLTQGTTTAAIIPFMLIEGDGNPANVNAIALGAEGVPGADTGSAAIIQVTDQYGAAVAGSPVTFMISPRGAFTLQSVSGEPACTSNATSATCNTDQFGFAYAEIVAGATVRQATISTTVAGNPFSGDVNIQAAPNVTGVADAAAGLTTVAPGSYIAIYGTGLSNYTDGNSTVYNPNSTPTTEATDPVIANGAVLPLQIDYVTVSFDVPSAGISVPGHITFVSPTQVNVQVPWELQGQSSVQVKVTLDGDLLGNVYTLQLAKAAPAFFTYNNIAIGTDTKTFGLLTASNPAVRGSTIVLYANGLGAVNNQPASGDPAGASSLSTLVTLPTVTIGGANAQVAYAGLVPSLPGLYQLNLVVPTSISAGTQNIVVTAGGQTSTSTLPVQ